MLDYRSVGQLYRALSSLLLPESKWCEAMPAAVINYTNVRLKTFDEFFIQSISTVAVISETEFGLYCEAGDFYVDPWRPVERAIVTHAHSDHARWGSKKYLAARAGEHILRMRLGNAATYRFVDYGEATDISGVKVSLHPAGHMTGSSQVRIEHRGEITVVSGDYKLQSDPTCQTFEPVKCHIFVTESTFGMPIYQWADPLEVFEEINQWWRENQAKGKCSVLFGYTVGKAQRLISGVDASIGPIFGHGAILNACLAYEKCGVDLPSLQNVMSVGKKFDYSKSLVIAPPSARGSTWLRRFGNVSLAMASGWMQVRGIRRRRAVDRGFIISDHVDWPDLLTAIDASGAESVWVTHGYTRQVSEYLKKQGLNARVVETQFRGELEESDNNEEQIPIEDNVE
jgi:putative mRNA 3-end processing factor